MTERRRLPNCRSSETFDIESQGLQFTATVSRFADGRVAEIFLQNHKAGTRLASTRPMRRSSARLRCNTACRSKPSGGR